MDQRWKCRIWKGLGGLGVIALVLAWLAGKDGTMLGLDTWQWYWNALIFAVLSIPIKLDCHSCGVCAPPKAS